jgi:hypothetical protein
VLCATFCCGAIATARRPLVRAAQFSAVICSAARSRPRRS